MERSDILSRLMKNDLFGFQPLRWREAFGGEAPPDHIQNEGISKDLIENKGMTENSDGDIQGCYSNQKT